MGDAVQDIVLIEHFITKRINASGENGWSKHLLDSGDKL
jgi:hypothetical protein